MHACPGCGVTCDCDGDDAWDDFTEDECVCGCEVTFADEFGDPE